MKCGSEFGVRSVNGMAVTRFVYLCDNWLAIQRAESYPRDHPLALPCMGGLGQLMTWEGVLTYLAKIAMRGEGYDVAGPKMFFQLDRVMRVSELAQLLDRPPEDIRKELADYVIQIADA